MTELFIGLMSGTSMDGIDAALVDLSGKRLRLVTTHSPPYGSTLLRQLEQGPSSAWKTRSGVI